MGFVLNLWAMNEIINPLTVHWSCIYKTSCAWYCLVFHVLCSIPLNDYKLLVCDIQQLLVAVTIHSCSSSGSQYFRIIEDLITLLGFMQTSKMRRTQGEGWISEIQYTCKIHWRCHLPCAAVLYDIKLSGSAAERNRAVTSLSSTVEWRVIWEISRISICPLNGFLSFSPKFAVWKISLPSLAH